MTIQVICEKKGKIMTAQHPAFQRIALLGKVNHEATRTTLQNLEQQLLSRGYEVFIEVRTAEQLHTTQATVVDLHELGDVADLAVVVGGDGNMLGAARVLYVSQIAVIGVNRSNLGFLTDVTADHLMEQLSTVLQGHSLSERRFASQPAV